MCCVTQPVMGGVMMDPPMVKLDPWEFPRHHLKVFNILGEGCFGQVWKCEALNIDGKSFRFKEVYNNKARSYVSVTRENRAV